MQRVQLGTLPGNKLRLGNKLLPTLRLGNKLLATLRLGNKLRYFHKQHIVQVARLNWASIVVLVGVWTSRNEEQVGAEVTVIVGVESPGRDHMAPKAQGGPNGVAFCNLAISVTAIRPTVLDTPNAVDTRLRKCLAKERGAVTRRSSKMEKMLWDVAFQKP